MASPQSDMHEHGRQGELHVERLADKMSRSDSGLREERSVGELFRQLSNDTAELVRQEVALVKAELRQTGTTLARDAAKVGTAVALAFLGAMALTAFLIAGLGGILSGKYWLSALIVGTAYLAIGVTLTKNALADIKRRGIGMKHAVETVRNTATWAKQEASDVKQRLTT